MKLPPVYILTLIFFFSARVGDTKIPSSVLYDMRDIQTLPDLLRTLPIEANNDIPSRGNRPSRPRASDVPFHVFSRNQVNSFQSFPDVPTKAYSMPVNLSGEVDIAELPGCEPRPTIIKTESLQGMDENTIFWPHCISVNRCSGCCNNDLFECVAVETRQRTTQLLRLVYDTLEMSLNVDGVASIDVQDDTECACRCKVSPSQCRRDREVFLNCQCQCQVELICPPNFRWDPVTCDCVCGVPHAERSCRSKRERFNSTECGCTCDPAIIQRCHAKGLRFNHEKCRCISRSRYDLSDSS